VSVLPVRSAGELAQSERNLLAGALMAAGVLALFWLLRVLSDAWWGAEPESAIRGAAEMATRAFTIPHVVVAFLFMSTAARNRRPRRWAQIAGLLGLGALLCAGFAGMLNTGAKALGSLALYSYFLVHELRDEAAFYALLGDAPHSEQAEKRFKGLVSALIALSVAGVALVLLFSNLFRRHPTIALHGLSPLQVLTCAVAVSAMWAAGLFGVLAWFARGSENGVAAIREHGRLFRLFALVLLVTALGAALTGKMYTVVLLHVCVWYVFTCRNLRRNPPHTPAHGWWGWMRGTLPGFQTLHLGLAAGMVVLVVLALSGFSSRQPLWMMFTPAALPYWTIMHITVSFMPR
jgi:hypothetical protein